jgi:aminoglycoside 6'-N-acetyltransferase
MPDLSLRAAKKTDIEILRFWDAAPHVRDAKGSEDWGWEHEIGRCLPWREQLIAEVAGHPIGYVEIIDPAEDSEHYWGDIGPHLRAIDIWIGDAAYLAQGYGTAMMQAALARCFSEPSVEAVVVDPLSTNTRAHRFYERLGFRPMGRRQFGEDDCLIHRLERDSWQHAGGT